MITKGGRKTLVDHMRLSMNIKFHLFTASTANVADEDLMLADMTEATFSAYVAKDIANFSTPAINAAFQGETDGPVMEWPTNGNMSVQNIIGLYATCTDPDGQNRHLLGLARFAAAVPIFAAGDVVRKSVNFFATNIVP